MPYCGKSDSKPIEATQAVQDWIEQHEKPIKYVRPTVCVACGGRGRASNNTDCVPCEGTGVQGGKRKIKSPDKEK